MKFLFHEAPVRQYRNLIEGKHMGERTKEESILCVIKV